MRAAFRRVDVVRIGEDRVLIAVVVLKRDLDLGLLALAREVDGPVHRLARAVEVLDVGLDPVLLLIGDGLARLLVGEVDLHAPVEIGQLLQPGQQPLGFVLDGLEDLRVRPVAHLGAGLLRLALGLELALDLAALEAHVVDLATAGDFDLEPLAERVHHRHAHTVQAARDLIGAAAELAARVKHGHRYLNAGALLDRVLVNGNAAAVVGDGDGIVLVEDAIDLRAVPGHHLIDAVVNYLDKEVMKAARPCGSYVHRRPTTYRFQPL